MSLCGCLSVHWRFIKARALGRVLRSADYAVGVIIMRVAAGSADLPLSMWDSEDMADHGADGFIQYTQGSLVCQEKDKNKRKRQLFCGKEGGKDYGSVFRHGFAVWEGEGRVRGKRSGPGYSRERLMSLTLSGPWPAPPRRHSPTRFITPDPSPSTMPPTYPIPPLPPTVEAACADSVFSALPSPRSLSSLPILL